MTTELELHGVAMPCRYIRQELSSFEVRHVWRVIGQLGIVTLHALEIRGLGYRLYSAIPQANGSQWLGESSAFHAVAPIWPGERAVPCAYVSTRYCYLMESRSLAERIIGAYLRHPEERREIRLHRILQARYEDYADLVHTDGHVARLHYI